MNSPKKTARLAGFLYLLMVPFGIFGIMWSSSLIVHGDAATTANNIMAAGSLFRSSIVSALMVQVVGIFVVLVLYKLLKPVNKTHALLMVIFILLGTPIAMLNQLNQFAAQLLLSGANYLTAFKAGQLQAQVMLFLNLHEHGVTIAGIFWGLWLFPMGYLVFKSGFLPRILGVLLMIACFSYLIDSFGRLLLPNFGETIIAAIIEFTLYGEILFPLWLLIKGVDVEKWEKRALESA